MTILRSILKALDVPGGRSFLAWYASRHARRATNRDIAVLYDQMWMHRIDDRYWADSERFAYHRKIAAKWVRYANHEDAWAREFWFHAYKPSPGNVIVDIGAGSGTDMPEFSKAVGPTGKVIAVEAHPQTFRMLQQCVRKNQLQNVICVHKAIVDKSGPVTITDIDKHVGNAVSRNQQGQGFVVDGCTLSELCKEIDIVRIDFLKMNIEGAENFAIHGMTEVMSHIRRVCIACHDFRAERGDGEEYRSRDSIVKFLTQHGFETQTRVDETRPAIRDHVHATNLAFVDKTSPDAKPAHQ